MDVALVVGVLGLAMVFLGTAMIVFRKDTTLAMFLFFAGLVILSLFVSLRVKQTVRVMIPVSTTLISEK